MINQSFLDTTFAKNDVNGDWYEFNDSYVAKIDPSKICVFLFLFLISLKF